MAPPVKKRKRVVQKVIQQWIEEDMKNAIHHILTWHQVPQ